MLFSSAEVNFFSSEMNLSLSIFNWFSLILPLCLGDSLGVAELSPQCVSGLLVRSLGNLTLLDDAYFFLWGEPTLFFLFSKLLFVITNNFYTFWLESYFICMALLSTGVIVAFYFLASAEFLELSPLLYLHNYSILIIDLHELPSSV